MRADALDLAIVGAGLSGCALLFALSECLALSAATTSTAPLQPRITLFDKHADFGGGVAYGQRVGPAFLLNNEASELASSGFFDWLGQHPPPLQRYLPRALFGDFLRARLREVVRQANNAIRLCHNEVRDLTPLAGGWRLTLANGTYCDARRVVLALGTVPASGWPQLRPTPGYCDDLHQPDWYSNATRLAEHLRRTPRQRGQRRLMVIGANASAMEALFGVEQYSDLCHQIDRLLLVAPNLSPPRGGLPDAGRSALPIAISPQLQQLCQSPVGPEPSARLLINALAADIEQAKARGYTTLDATLAARAPFADSFSRLPLAQKQRFVACYGDRYKQLTRRVPPAYAATAAVLQRRGQLRLWRRRLGANDIQFSDDGSYTVNTGPNAPSLAVGAVINASGSCPLLDSNDPLLSRLRQRFAMTPGGQGFQVDKRYALAPGCYLIGPLLTGLCHADEAIWHLESIPRILALAQRLGQTLAQQLAE